MIFVNQESRIIYNFEKLEAFLEKRIQVQYAGAMAEAFDHNRKYDEHYACNEWVSGGAKSDFSKIEQLVQVLRNVRHPSTTDEKIAGEELEVIDSLMFNTAHSLVENNLPIIERIRDALSRKVEIYDTNYQINEQEIDQIYQDISDMNNESEE